MAKKRSNKHTMPRKLSQQRKHATKHKAAAVAALSLPVLSHKTKKQVQTFPDKLSAVEEAAAKAATSFVKNHGILPHGEVFDVGQSNPIKASAETLDSFEIDVDSLFSPAIYTLWCIWF